MCADTKIKITKELCFLMCVNFDLLVFNEYFIKFDQFVPLLKVLRVLSINKNT